MSNFDYQCGQILNELELIHTKTWPLNHREGTFLIQKIFKNYALIFDDENNASNSALDSLSFSKVKILLECNDLLENLQNTVLANLVACSDRIIKLTRNMSKLFDIKNGSLGLLGVCELEFLRDLMNQFSVSYEEEIVLKNILICDSIFTARLGHAERLSVLAAWIHEPYLDESLTARLKAIVEVFKKQIIN